MVRYYPDGSGYPGSPAEYELISVHVHQWTEGTVTLSLHGDDSAAWKALDDIAYGYVDEHWDEYESDLAEKESEGRYGSE